jgi:hypothetical protein
MRKEDVAMERIIPLFEETFRYRRGVGECIAGIGHFAGLVRLNKRQALAIKTDGVGTKVLVAEVCRKYNTIGIDCIAMNVNDIICLGAEPLALVNYLALEKPRPHLVEEVMKGLQRGAQEAGVAIISGSAADPMRAGASLPLVATPSNSSSVASNHPKKLPRASASVPAKPSSSSAHTPSSRRRSNFTGSALSPSTTSASWRPGPSSGAHATCRRTPAAGKPTEPERPAQR